MGEHVTKGDSKKVITERLCNYHTMSRESLSDGKSYDRPTRDRERERADKKHDSPYINVATVEHVTQSLDLGGNQGKYEVV